MKFRIVIIDVHYKVAYKGESSFCHVYRIYPKYSDTLVLFNICPKI